MQAGLRSVTIKFRPEMVEQIKVIAEKRGETLSDTIRHLISRGLDERVCKENTELIAAVVREQVESVLDAYLIFPASVHAGRAKKMTARTFDARVALCRPYENTNLVS